MDFTLAISVLNFAIIQPMPNIYNRFMAPIKPFQSTVHTASINQMLGSHQITSFFFQVWYMIFVAFGATVIFLSVIMKCTGSNKRVPIEVKSRVVSETVWYTFSVLVAQGNCLFFSHLIQKVERVLLHRRLFPVQSFISPFHRRFLVSGGSRLSLRLQWNADFSRIATKVRTNC